MGKRYIPRYLSDRAKKKSAGTAAAVFAVGFVLLAILAGAVIGRYLHQIRSGGLIRAKEFYFTSNFLDGDTHTLAPGSTKITFTLGNYADELRFSEVDITYKVTVTSADSATTPTVEYDNEEQKLTKDAKQDDKVTITNLEAGTYTVTATGAGGYKKALTAIIVVPATESAVYKYLDTTNSKYVLLTVWSQGYEGEVTITPPQGLIPDNTDLVMGSVTTNEEFTDETSFKNNGYCSHTYRFFGGGVTVENFTVTYGSQTATVKAPR